MSLLYIMRMRLVEPQTMEKRTLEYVCLSQSQQWSCCSEKLIAGTTLLESLTFQQSVCESDHSCHHSRPCALWIPSLQERCDQCPQGAEICRGNLMLPRWTLVSLIK